MALFGSFQDAFKGDANPLGMGADLMTMGTSSLLDPVKPILGGITDTLSGKPSPMQQYHLPTEARESFLQSPEQKQFLDYLQKKVYSPAQRSSEAEALLAQKTDQTRAATAGAMASARGVYNPALLAREAAKINAAAEQQAVQAGAVMRAQEEAQARQEQAQREKDFLAALEQERERRINFETLRAGVESGNIEAINKAQEAARNRQVAFLSGLGQAGATVAAGA